MTYLFIGQDSVSKDIKLKKIKEEFLTKEVEAFNLDILYTKELNLKVLQEKLLCLPIKAKKRILVIKDAQDLKGDIKEFIINYLRKPHPQIILILDITSTYQTNLKTRQAKIHLDEFIKRIGSYSQICRFREPLPINTFVLSRQIELKRPHFALKVLNQLLQNGERPEMILGGLRSNYERNVFKPLERRKRLKLLLNCDIEIKTGRLKPELALEKLVAGLCYL
jgi:DNA polymerase III delta subunit